MTTEVWTPPPEAMLLPPGIRGKVIAHLLFSEKAAAEEHYDYTLMHKLQALDLVPTGKENEHEQLRHDLIQRIGTIFINLQCWPLMDESFSILKRLYNDKKERVFLRATAAFVLSYHYLERMNAPEAVKGFNDTISFCNAATRNDRERIIKRGSSTESVGVILDESINKKPPFEKFLGDWGVSGMQLGVAQEYLELRKVPQFQTDEELFKRAPTITTDVLETVKGLPEGSKAFLIMATGRLQGNPSIHGNNDAPMTNPRMSPMWRDMEAMHQRRFKDGRSDQDQAIRKKLCGLWDNKLRYQAFEVDLSRFQRGKASNVVRSIKTVVCEPNSSHEKNLLSTFVAACLEPERHLFSTPEPPERPKRVLFATEKDAKHPQIRSFLSLMGCAKTEIGVPDPELNALVRQSLLPENVDMSVAFNKKEMPHLHDLHKGIKCANCSKVGPDLLKCACGKAYFCNEECRVTAWEAHRIEHKDAMKRSKIKVSQEKSKTIDH